jgi:hypothetical protein
MNVISPKYISKWQMGFNSAFKGLSGNFSLLKTVSGVGNTKTDETETL